jgi:hypothetical protein
MVRKLLRPDCRYHCLSALSSPSSSSEPASVNSKKSRTYTAAIYSIVAAATALVFGPTLKGGY